MSLNLEVLPLNTLKEIYGAISTSNTKMGTTTFAIDAFSCKIGNDLSSIKNSVCSGCYAKRIQKIRPGVDKGWKRNLTKYNNAVLSNDRQGWVYAISKQITRYNTDGYHRWFDSGDLQSREMLLDILEVCRHTPYIKHWLPTRELTTVNSINSKDIPDNLVIRVSSPMIDQKPIKGYVNTSTVHRSGSTVYGIECKAYERKNTCGDCKACWNSEVYNVSYKKH